LISTYTSLAFQHLLLVLFGKAAYIHKVEGET